MKNLHGIVSMTIIILLLITLLVGCAGEKNSLTNVEEITLERYYPDPMSHEVYVISQDLKVRHYDFTLYWIKHNHIFDYYSEPLPSESEYILKEWRITEAGWDLIIDALEENKFYKLPEEIKSPAGAMDGGSTYIGVKANGAFHKSGGYLAGHRNDRTSKRNRNIEDAINTIMKNEKAAEFKSNTIKGFYFYYPSGSMPDNYFEIIDNNDDAILKVFGHSKYGTFETRIEKSALSDLQDIVSLYDIASWNGFETPPDTETTTGNLRFVISIEYDDLTMIFANGDHAFPDRYKEVEEALLKFLDNLLESKHDEI